MLGNFDKWICESLLYIDFKQKKKGQDKLLRFALLLILSSTVFLNFITLNFVIFAFGFPELTSNYLVPLCLSFVVLFLLYGRYHYNDNYILFSEKKGHKKKLWNTVIIYIIFTFFLMWAMIIYALLTE